MRIYYPYIGNAVYGGVITNSLEGTAPPKETAEGLKDGGIIGEIGGGQKRMFIVIQFRSFNPYDPYDYGYCPSLGIYCWGYGYYI